MKAIAESIFDICSIALDNLSNRVFTHNQPHLAAGDEEISPGFFVSSLRSSGLSIIQYGSVQCHGEER
ncbi:hypothetical protein [Microcoleus sp. bin38.metabat.b11b12b14.051]|uniref:hypothetical protein n=1 Tax=Microcoleus sp. bin38.metabat.b11b12b14.051 TaxID=2742709 RepID=UPI0025E35736|nr:hypothetical protein [Microcoleus sp. bin38.metabat.b11b12b14.051]